MMLANPVIGSVSRSGPAARSKSDRQGGGTGRRKGVELAAAGSVEPAIDLEGVIVMGVRLEVLLRKSHHFMVVGFGADRRRVNRTGQQGAFADRQPRAHPCER